MADPPPLSVHPTKFDPLWLQSARGPPECAKCDAKDGLDSGRNMAIVDAFKASSSALWPLVATVR